MARWLYFLLALATASLAMPTIDSWAVVTVTTKVAVNPSGWTNLTAASGVPAGPLLISSNGEIVYVVSDTTPTIPVNEGFPLPSNTAFTVNTGSNVWAMSKNDFIAYVYVAPILAGGGSTGGGSFSGVLTGPLGPNPPTAPTNALSVTDTGSPVTGMSIGSGQGTIGWLSQLDKDVNGVVNLAVGGSATVWTAHTIGSNTGADVNLIGTNGVAISPDACTNNFINAFDSTINLTATGVIIPHSGTKKTYLCHLHIVAPTAVNVALVEGGAPNCTTNIFGLAGGTIAAQGWNLTSNGISLGNGGATFRGVTNTAGDDVCLVIGSAVQVSGSVRYVQQ